MSVQDDQLNLARPGLKLRGSTLVGCICYGKRTENERTWLPVRLSFNPDPFVASLEQLVDLNGMKCRIRGRRQDTAMSILIRYRGSLLVTFI